MTTSRMFLTTVQVILPESLLQEPEVATNPSRRCVLYWRQNTLWVKLVESGESGIPALQSDAWLRDCLVRSSVKRVCLDPNLGESNLRTWANICKQAGKAVFLQVPISRKGSQSSSTQWRLLRIIDWLMTVILLLTLLPTVAALGGLIKIISLGHVFQSQWYVGQRGRLFELVQFRTLTCKNGDIHPLSQWIRNSGVEKLPQLINVLRGNMSLFGMPPYSLDEIDSLSLEQRSQLRALPGVIRDWRTNRRSKVADATTIACCDR